MPSLADLLRGGPELGPLELGGGIAAAQAADPRMLTGGPGVGGAIANFSAATTAQPLAEDYARRIAAVQAAAQPDLLKYLASEEPLKTAAADTGGNPTARWAVSQMSPLQLAQAREANVLAELNKLDIPIPNQRRIPLGAPGGAAAAGVSAGGAAPGRAAAAAPAELPDAGSFGSGEYVPDPATVRVSPAAYERMTKRQKALFLQKLQMLRAPAAAAAAPPGGVAAAAG
jgi:hypothetical protein